MRQRKLVARMYVDMTYMDENKGRNLQFIYDRLAGSVLGISYKTFLDYLDEEKDSLDGITLPDYVLLGMWTSVRSLESKLTGKRVFFPAEMLRKLKNTQTVRRRKQQEKRESKQKQTEKNALPSAEPVL